MSMSLGELSGTIRLDDSAFDRALTSAGSGMRQLVTVVDGAAGRIESDMRSAASGAEQAMAGAADDMAADIQQATTRMTRSLDGAIEDPITRGTTAAEAELEDLARKFNEIAREFETSGGRAGKSFGDSFSEGAGAGFDGLGDSMPGRGDRAGADFSGGFKGAGIGGLAAAAGPIGAAVAVASVFVAAGVAAAQYFADAFAQHLEQEDAVALLSAQVGAFGPESEKLGAAAGSMYADAYGENIGEVTEALKDVTYNIEGMGDASQEELERMGRLAIDTGRILDEDVGKVSEAVGQMMRTGLADSAEEAFDILVRGAQEGANRSEDLIDTFREYPNHFRDLGLSADDAMGLMIQGLDGGARHSDLVADALKELTIRTKALDNEDALAQLGLDADAMASAMSEGGPAARDALDSILSGLGDIEDPAERAALAVELFGTQGEDMAQALGELDLSTAAGELGEVEGAAETAGEAIHGTLGQRLESFKRTAKQSVVDFIDQDLLPAFDRFAEGADIGGKFEEPVQKFQDLWGDVQDTFAEFQEEHGPKIAETTDLLEESFQGMSDTIGAVVDFVSVLWEEWGETILFVATEKIGGVLEMINGNLQFLQGLFTFFTGLITGDWDKAMEGLRMIGEGAWKSIKGLFRLATAEVRGIVETKFQETKDTAKGKLDDMVADVKALPGRAKRALGDLGSTLLQAGKDLIQGLIDGIDNKVQDLKSKLAGVTDSLPDWKGPRPVDLTILTPAGEAVMDGFMAGIDRRRDSLRAQLGGITADLPAMATPRTVDGDRFGRQAGGGGVVVENVTVNSMGGQFSTRQVLEDVAWKLAG